MALERYGLLGLCLSTVAALHGIVFTQCQEIVASRYKRF